MEKLSEYNVGYGLHFPANHLLSYVKERFPADRRDRFPRRSGRRQASSPCRSFRTCTDEDVQYVGEAIREILRHDFFGYSRL